MPCSIVEPSLFRSADFMFGRLGLGPVIPTVGSALQSLNVQSTPLGISSGRCDELPYIVIDDVGLRDE